MKTVLALRHVPHESLGAIERLLRAQGVPWRYVDWFDATPPAAFEPEQHAGLVVLGGPMNVDQVKEFPFLATEVEWIGRAIAAGLPVLGICLGSQLLAKALGSRVYANRVKEIGWYALELLPAAASDPLFGGARSPATVFQWHGDTFNLPPGAVQLARSEACEVQAFRHGTAWGMQFHLEVTAEMVESWLAEPQNCGELATLDYIDPRQVRGQTPTAFAEMQPLAEQVLGRFVGCCREAAGCVPIGRSGGRARR